MRPVRVELELPKEVTLLNGKKRVELGHLEGRSNKLDVTILLGGSPTDNRARVEWVLHGPAESLITFHIRSERAGSLHRTIKLS